MDLTRLLYLSKRDVYKIGKETSNLYINAVSEALIIHARRDFVQPLKPYLRTKSEDYHIADRVIAMPAHMGGNYFISGIKWIGSKHDNPTKRKLERASGLIILNDPDSNYPIAVIEASLISSMRTAAVTAVAVRHLAKKSFTEIACLGCGVRILRKSWLRACVYEWVYAWGSGALAPESG